MKNEIEVIIGNKNNKEHMENMLVMLDLYMHDPMGGEKALSPELAQKNIDGLKRQSNYLFFIAKYKGELAGVANCFVGFSTFKGQQLLNVHDFAVSPACRRKGVGDALMATIIAYSKDHDYCKVTLEVRKDNPKAQSLYRKVGFIECDPEMHFWEKRL
jgi:ribosomal protein S18 acetylase RimI-like enzyme